MRVGDDPVGRHRETAAVTEADDFIIDDRDRHDAHHTARSGGDIVGARRCCRKQCGRQHRDDHRPRPQEAKGKALARRGATAAVGAEDGGQAGHGRDSDRIAPRGTGESACPRHSRAGPRPGRAFSQHGADRPALRQRRGVRSGMPDTTEGKSGRAKPLRGQDPAVTGQGYPGFIL